MDMFATIEGDRLRWVAGHQDTVRADSYRGVQDANADAMTTGRGIVPCQLHGRSKLHAWAVPGELLSPSRCSPHVCPLLLQRFSKCSRSWMSCSRGAGTCAKLLPLPVSGTASLGAQDAMAIVRRFDRPDIFGTVTCNPDWPEINRELLPSQTAADRPDVVCRVFQVKLVEIMDDMIKLGVCGAGGQSMRTAE